MNWYERLPTSNITYTDNSERLLIIANGFHRAYSSFSRVTTLYDHLSEEDLSSMVRVEWGRHPKFKLYFHSNDDNHSLRVRVEATKANREMLGDLGYPNLPDNGRWNFLEIKLPIDFKLCDYVINCLKITNKETYIVPIPSSRMDNVDLVVEAELRYGFGGRPFGVWG